MKNEQFEMLLEKRLELTKSVLSKKAEEYSSDFDRLHNFKEAAKVMRTTQKQSCFAFMTKHLVSIADMVESKQDFAYDYIDEKIGDAINYLILLEAILKEE